MKKVKDSKGQVRQAKRSASAESSSYASRIAELSYLPQAVEDNETIAQQVVAQLILVLWGHHRTIIDKCKGDLDKALFYVRRTIQNGLSRNSLLNWLSTDLYEREEKCCQYSISIFKESGCMNKSDRSKVLSGII